MGFATNYDFLDTTSYLSTFLDSFLSKEICYDLISELERPYLI